MNEKEEEEERHGTKAIVPMCNMRAMHQRAAPSFFTPLLLHNKKERERGVSFLHPSLSIHTGKPPLLLPYRERNRETKREIERSNVRLLLSLLSSAVECPAARGGRRGRGGEFRPLEQRSTALPVIELGCGVSGCSRWPERERWRSSGRSRPPECSGGGPLGGPPFVMEPSQSMAWFGPGGVPTGSSDPSRERRPPPAPGRHPVGSGRPPSASLAVV